MSRKKIHKIVEAIANQIQARCLVLWIKQILPVMASEATLTEAPSMLVAISYMWPSKSPAIFFMFIYLFFLQWPLFWTLFCPAKKKTQPFWYVSGMSVGLYSTTITEMLCRRNGRRKQQAFVVY